MVRSFHVSRLAQACVAAVVLLAAGLLMAGPHANRAAVPQGETIELFAGIEKGLIEVQLVPKDSTQCNLLVTNKTDKPLSVKLPEAFAGTPVLAQNIGFPDLLSGQSQNNAPQTLGLTPGQNVNRPQNRTGPLGVPVRGPGPVGPRPGPNLAPRPLFNVAPEQVAKLPLTAVCLDYGKPTPRAAMKYEVKPIASVTDKEGVAEICEMLGRGEIGQPVAQLAAWHLNNGLSWEKLSHLHQRGALGMVPTYTSRQIAAARQAVEKACKTAQEHQQIEKGQAKEPGKLSGRSQSEALSAN